MTDFRPFDVVRLLNGIPDHGVPPGARGVILEIRTEPRLALELEVMDDAGMTLFVGPIDPVEVVSETYRSADEAL